MLNDIIVASGLHPSRIFNVYLFGSTVYGTTSEKSDVDVIIIANNSVESIEIKSGIYNIHIYTPDKFKSDLNWHMPKNLEVFFSPSNDILKSDITFELKIDNKKLRHAISHVSSNSWVKSKKKITIANEYYIGIKSLWHSIRIPMFGEQIMKYGKIVDFGCANDIWYKLISKDYKWEELDDEFREIHHRVLSDFRKVCSK